MISSMEKTLLVLGGPTASGKTACGIRVAGHFETEIISADSRQIFMEPSIGTAVPSKKELESVPHHFIQCTSLAETYNASKFEQQVLSKLETLFSVHDLVLMVGGSGLYIEAVCGGIDDLPPADPDLRKHLHQRLRREGLLSLAEELRKRDPVTHEKVDLKNHMRVLKALEVSIQTGKPYSEFLSATPKTRPFRILRAALHLEREELYRRINARVDQMMESGLLEEVERLIPFRENTAMKTVGYRELFRHLDGEITLEEAVDLIKRNTRKFARKQITWFRKENRFHWIDADHPEKVIEWVENQIPLRARD